MDRERRERLKDECIHKGYYQGSSVILELIADLEAAEEDNRVLIVGVERHQKRVGELIDLHRQAEEKVQKLRAALAQIQRFCKTDDPNFHRAHKALEGSR